LFFAKDGARNYVKSYEYTFPFGSFCHVPKPFLHLQLTFSIPRDLLQIASGYSSFSTFKNSQGFQWPLQELFIK